MVAAMIFSLISFLFLSISANNYESPGLPSNLDYYSSMLKATYTSPNISDYANNPPYHIVGNKLKYDDSVFPRDINKLYYHIDAKLKYADPVTPEEIDEIYKLAKSEKPKEDVVDRINLDFVNLTIFHKYNDIRMGNKMTLWFTNQGPRSARLLKHQHPKMLSPYTTHPDLCGKLEAWEEQRSCVESLEEMVAFVVGFMGSNVNPIYTPEGKWQTYTIVGRGRPIRHQLTGCHKQLYIPYAVYGCHYIPNSLVRIVPLVGDDGTKLEAISICHMDTTSWNPQHLLFLLLKTKPGPPVCHFLATDDIIWITK